jgi:hypothetical protein
MKYNMFKKLLILKLLLVLTIMVNAQVKIGTNPGQISKAAILELESTNKGLLLPRIQDTTLLDTLNPPDGLLIFIKDVNNNQNILVRKNGKWESLQASNTSNVNLVAGSGISIASGTISATGLTTANIANNAAITNTQLANSATTLGSTTMSLGGTYTSVAGLTSITANNFIGTLSGTASTANKLTNARLINGQSFDGTADINLPIGANALTFNTTGTGANYTDTYNGSAPVTISYNTIGAAPKLGSRDINTVGTITTGTWSGTTITVANGGTGTYSLTGYVKGGGTTPLFALDKIPSTDVTGLLKTVNGIGPDANGNATVLIGRVFTNDLNHLPANGDAAYHNSDIFVVSGDGTVGNNGRTYIYDGTNWLELSYNMATTDARYILQAGGSTLTGNLTVHNSTNNANILLIDPPTGNTSAVNKGYVDYLTTLSSLTTVGTITTGVWSGTAIANSKLENSSTLLGATTLTLGGTATSVIGLNALTSSNVTVSGTSTNTSGLKFGNLTSASPAITASNKVLSLDGLGNVTLTNVPGTQNIVSFNTSNPNSGSPTFIPNTPSDQSVIYQSSVDNSLWIYNGSTYVTYTAPSTTEWYLGGTANDAGSNKTSSIFRTGAVGIGTNSPTAKLDVAAGTTTNTTGINLTGNVNDFLQYNVRNTSTGTGAQSGYTATADNGNDASGFAWMGINNSGFNNPTAYNIGAANDVTYIGSGNDMQIANANTNKSIIFSTGKLTSPYFTERMRIAPTGNVGIGTYNTFFGVITPTTTLHVQSQLDATNTVNADANVFRMSRNTTNSAKWDNIAQYNLGSYIAGGGDLKAYTRLDLVMSDGTTPTKGVAASELSNVMTWQANGRVGIGTTAPTQGLTVQTGVNIDNGNANTGTTTNALMFGSSGSGEGIGSTRTGTNNQYGLNFFTAGLQRMVINNTGNVGIGTTTPVSTLQVNNSLIAEKSNNANANVLRLSRPIWYGYKWNNIAQFNLGSYSTSGNATSRLDLALTDGSDTTTFTTAMTWLANGNVGIGTTAPYSQFANTTTAIQGANMITGISQSINWVSSGTGFGMGLYNSNASGNGLLVKTAATSSSTYAFEVSTGANQAGPPAATPLFDVLGNGNVGIGTFAPAYPLHISSTGSPLLMVQSSTTASGQAVVALNNPTQEWRLISQGSSNGNRFDIHNQTSNSPALSIAPSTLYVGIGTTSAAGKLVVNDNSYIANIPTTTANLMDNSTFRPASRVQVTNGANNNGLSNYFTTTTVATQAHNYITGAQLTYALQPAGGLLTVGGTLKLTGISSNTTSPTVVTTSGSTVDNILMINSSGEVYKTPLPLVSVKVSPTTASATVPTGTYPNSYTLVAADNNSVIYINTSSNSVTVILPTLSPGFMCQVIQDGSNQVTFTTAAGVTLSAATASSPNVYSRTTNSAVGITYKTATAVYLTGDLLP